MLDEAFPFTCELNQFVPSCGARLRGIYIPMPMPPMITMESGEWKIENEKPAIIFSIPGRSSPHSEVWSSVRGGRRIFFDIPNSGLSFDACRDRIGPII